MIFMNRSVIPVLLVHFSFFRSLGKGNVMSELSVHKLYGMWEPFALAMNVSVTASEKITAITGVENEERGQEGNTVSFPCTSSHVIPNEASSFCLQPTRIKNVKI